MKTNNYVLFKSVIFYCHLSFKNYKHLLYAFRLPTYPRKMHCFSVTNGKASFLYLFFVLTGYFVFDLCSHGVYLEISWLQIMKYVVIISKHSSCWFSNIWTLPPSKWSHRILVANHSFEMDF